MKLAVCAVLLVVAAVSSVSGDAGPASAPGATGNAALLEVSTVAALKERIIDIQNASNLGLRRLSLSKAVYSFGQYEPFPSSSVARDATVFLYIEPANLYTARDGGLYFVEFIQDLFLVDSAGTTVIEAPELLVFSYQSYSPVLDIYAQNTIHLTGLPPGDYSVVVVIRDSLGGDSARGEIPLRIVDR